ncbi:hypothetical protein CYMTET_56330 [Cymbomonas tetramitiformis]|uniref:Uncharacterized protein n=1 Tax=Cymbomonas tetramitiformis TaxID=36881 RepID=A0AAE0BCX6_9CHLO|nr:hypothetical protein CYMTET_56330 [Cymbomonas tetramitiformis]
MEFELVSNDEWDALESALAAAESKSSFRKSRSDVQNIPSGSLSNCNGERDRDGYRGNRTDDTTNFSSFSRPPERDPSCPTRYSHHNGVPHQQQPPRHNSFQPTASRGREQRPTCQPQHRSSSEPHRTAAHHPFRRPGENQPSESATATDSGHRTAAHNPFRRPGENQPSESTTATDSGHCAREDRQLWQSFDEGPFYGDQGRRSQGAEVPATSSQRSPGMPNAHHFHLGGPRPPFGVNQKPPDKVAAQPPLQHFLVPHRTCTGFKRTSQNMLK